MAHFIKTGFWEKATKGLKGWLNLEDIIQSIGGASIQFQNGGSDLGNNQASTVDFDGAGVSGNRVGNTIIYTIPGGGGGGSFATLTGQPTDNANLSTVLTNIDISIATTESNANTYTDVVGAEKQDYRFTTINNQTANYTAVIADAKNTLIIINNVADRTVTIQPVSITGWLSGTILSILRENTGNVTLVAGAGVNINPTNSDLTIPKRYQICNLVLIDVATNLWRFENGSSVSAADLGAVPLTRVFGGVDLSVDRTVDVVLAALGLRAMSFPSGANIVSTSTSYADVTGFSFAVTSGIKYRYRFRVYCSTSDTTEGIGLAVNGPATPTVLWYETRIPSGAGTIVFDAQNNAYDSPAATTSAPAGGDGVFLGEVYGVVQPSANGTFSLRVRAETGGANSVTVLKSGFSSMEYEIIP